ncbi:MAG: tRNA (N6-isopentenyl adenosine(37)-C2)-methylthiotransferase MiaB [Deltaproteobacteria bacterium]|nr:tRNA (N6-isopentenyl adenosine(37)-C2)-methylthiotransferase MiaB [Deltaproteobacteria bacterium]
MSKRLYINTIGCQMNVYDSEQIENSLRSLGYEPTPFVESADLIITNTCAIREKAEQKAFSFLGRLSRLKRKNADLIIGVGGCVAQQQGRQILKRMPHVDLVFGTHALSRLPLAIKKIAHQRCRIVDVEMSEFPQEAEMQLVVTPTDAISKFVTIMRGCDNYCAYCVVPYVRGRETSRNPDRIVSEINLLARSGVREVTLLGQNVNSYGKKEGLCSFAELLSRINEIEGLARIRFTTSHPQDLSEDLIGAFHRLDKLCHHMHLPVQSGSNRILKRMNRKYTREVYLEKVGRLREVCPQMAITSDIIVGFPGETMADFEDTVSLIRQLRYDSLFVFNYSDRPSAPSRKFPRKVDEQEKKSRLQHVLYVQAAITAEINAEMVGSQELVLVEGHSKRQPMENGKAMDRPVQWSGRTRCNKIVNFVIDGSEKTMTADITGNTVRVNIERALSHSLWGRWHQDTSANSGLKGDKSYAA